MHHVLSCFASCALLLGLGTAAVAAPAEDRHPLFDRIDTNHDGMISLGEWIAFRHEYAERRHEEAAQAGSPRTMAGLNAHHPAATTTVATTPSTLSAPATTAPHVTRSEEKHPLFDRIDTNHDGLISLSEWIAFRKAHKGAFDEHRQHAGAPPATAGAITPRAPGSTAPSL
jgi:hypothetical protein